MTNDYCPVCGQQTRCFQATSLSIDYFECTSCAFIFRDRLNIISAGEELAIYNNHENHVDDPRYTAYFRRFIESAVLPFFDAPRIGLDFGSGPEPVLATVLEKNYRFSMDIYDLFYAPEKKYQGKRYYLLTCTEVIEHLLDPLHYFRLFNSLLHNNGLLAVMTLFHPGSDEAFRQWFYPRDPSHISFYSIKSIQLLAEKSGFQLVYTDCIRYSAFKKIN